jgi:protocatechuate 3,4-dioxygenase beta subunit
MTSWDRRELLRRMCIGAAAVPLAKLAMACGDSSSGGDDSGDDGGDDAGSSDAPIGDSDWANGGTVAMTDKATYPDPFAGAVSSCVVVASTTEGPCNTPNTDLDREDVSEGGLGIPVRLAMKIVDTSCAPLAGATVKIWHTDRTGVYSGETPNTQFCSNGDPVAIAANWGRGVRTTNADGVVYFDTIYPGWYPGRAIHIHFQVRNGGTTYRISQLFFPENLTTAIFANHVDYTAFGQPDTTFANDGVIAPVTGDARDRLILDIAKMTDRAMLASKVITVM